MIYGSGAGDGQYPGYLPLTDQTPQGIIREIACTTSPFPDQTRILFNLGTFGDYTVSNGGDGSSPSINGSTSLQVTMNGVTQTMTFSQVPGAPFIQAEVAGDPFSIISNAGQSISFSVVPA